ncbi:MAG: L-threonylcarbamoyladenylate synthase [Bdellovibrionota bacterium]
MSAILLTSTPDHFKKIAQALAQGDVVGIPTETVYGLAGNVFSEKALAKIFSVKERPKFDPLIVHIPPFGEAVRENQRLEALESLCLVDTKNFSQTAKRQCEILMERFWPGPLTLVFPKHLKVPDLATSGLPSVAIRMPKHPGAQAILKLCKFPLAAPSANRFGKISPTTAQAVEQELGDRISLILDGGPSEVGLESTVVQIDPEGGVTLLRPGAISRQMLELALRIPLRDLSDHTSTGPFPSPGTSKSHYAPKMPLRVLQKPTMEMNAIQLSELLKTTLPGVGKHEIRIGLLTMSGDSDKSAMFFHGLTGVHVNASALSKTGNLNEIAKNLFRELRSLDQSQVHAIFVEPPPSKEGLGHAIWDRLNRASAI